MVCGRCSRWNLSALEERWEAIEEADRSFTTSKIRVSTENIALARVAEGIDLIRIGRAERAEVTGWRYGSHLRRRRMKQYAYTGAFIATAGTIVATGGYSALVALPGGALALHIPNWMMALYARFGVVARVETGVGERAAVRGKHVYSARLEHDGVDHRLIVPHDGGRTVVDGPETAVIASRLLARLNANGASARSLGHAIRHLDRTRTSRMAINEIARTLPGTFWPRFRHTFGSPWRSRHRTAVNSVPWRGN